VNQGPLSKQEVNKLLDYHNVGYEAEKSSEDAVRVVKYRALIEDNERILQQAFRSRRQFKRSKQRRKH
jgi:hypothetical protein